MEIMRKDISKSSPWGMEAMLTVIVAKQMTIKCCQIPAITRSSTQLTFICYIS